MEEGFADVRVVGWLAGSLKGAINLGCVVAYTSLGISSRTGVERLHPNVQQVITTVVEPSLTVICGGKGSQGSKNSKRENSDLDHNDDIIWV